jgi:anti-sigma regulatory factor (Ser/Thr protein kinase)
LHVYEFDRVAALAMADDGAEPAPQIQLSLQPDRFAPSRARSAIEAFASERELGSAHAATLTLLVSELVTNAVLHSDAPAGKIRLIVWMVDGRRHAIRVEVTDEGSGFEPTSCVGRGDHAAGGLGLYLVEREATRWGVRLNGVTRVWFELDGGID